MTFDLNNLSLKSLEKYHLVLDDIKFNMEIQNKTKYLDMGEFEGIEGVPKSEHQNIMNTLLNDTDLVDKVHRGGNRFGLDINVANFNNFLARVSERIAELKGNKGEFIEATTKYTKWENITIRFLNDYDVEIKNRNKIFKTNYEQMGFADNRKDTKQETEAKKSWKLLQALSMSKNVFSLNTLTLQERNRGKKHKQELSRLLKQYFGIADDPISYDETKREYRLKIKLIPEKPDEPQTWGRKIFKENSQ